MSAAIRLAAPCGRRFGLIRRRLPFISEGYAAFTDLEYRLTDHVVIGGGSAL